MAEPLTVDSFSTLRRFAQRKAMPAAVMVPSADQCEFCSAQLPAQHRHLLEVASRAICCVCQPCSILFDQRAASEGRYLLIPDRRLYLAHFQMSDSQWGSLRIPVGMAFFFTSTATGRTVAYYPSPMGPTESLLQLQTWQELVGCNPLLATMTPEVEALLVNRGVRTASSGPEHFLVPIDECYRLVGLLRSRWRGLSGGQEVWQELNGFFAALKARSKVMHP